jgi:antitoxin ParD1/3/4
MVGIIHTVRMEGTSMVTAEKISIALPPEMVHIVRAAVATGEYASSSEVIRDALRDWTYKRSLRMQGLTELRGVWQEALNDKTPGISADDVLNRLERKYQAIANAAGAAK